jgi:hypothetical protein
MSEEREVEVVARSIHLCDRKMYDPLWDELSRSCQSPYKERAKAAIADLDAYRSATSPEAKGERDE